VTELLEGEKTDYEDDDEHEEDEGPAFAGD